MKTEEEYAELYRSMDYNDLVGVYQDLVFADSIENWNALKAVQKVMKEREEETE